ncbi:MAG: hypothetical protein AB2598_16630 [Candidatus Thiodiazotropha sp.]
MLVAAALIALVVGVVHSLLGEILIFSKLRDSGIVPTRPAHPLSGRNVRILWATWHLATVFGWAFAGVLFTLAQTSDAFRSATLNATVCAFFTGSILVFIGTGGRHPGWIGLLAVAALTMYSTTA